MKKKRDRLFQIIILSIALLGNITYSIEYPMHVFGQFVLTVLFIAVVSAFYYTYPGL